MATSNQEQALQEAGRYLQLNREARICFTRRAQVNSFQDKIALQVQPWLINYSKSMTCVQLCTHPSDIASNFKIAILKDVVGLGTSWYCIVHHPKQEFLKWLKTIMFFLPLEKMFLYPAGGTLGGSFLQEPWLSQGHDLASKPSITFTEYLATFGQPDD